MPLNLLRLTGGSWGPPPVDPYLLGSFSTPRSNISWRARVATRNATQRGLRGEAPTAPGVYSTPEKLARTAEQSAGGVGDGGWIYAVVGVEVATRTGLTEVVDAKGQLGDGES